MYETSVNPLLCVLSLGYVYREHILLSLSLFNDDCSAGRSVRVSVDISLVSSLLQIAVEIGFDWVFYANENYAQMSVIPNCESADTTCKPITRCLCQNTLT